eukprot:scaffold254416_cov28-Tisochrysis_lutea.AAC.1
MLTSHCTAMPLLVERERPSRPFAEAARGRCGRTVKEWSPSKSMPIVDSGNLISSKLLYERSSTASCGSIQTPMGMDVRLLFGARSIARLRQPQTPSGRELNCISGRSSCRRCRSAPRGEGRLGTGPVGGLPKPHNRRCSRRPPPAAASARQKDEGKTVRCTRLPSPSTSSPLRIPSASSWRRDASSNSKMLDADKRWTASESHSGAEGTHCVNDVTRAAERCSEALATALAVVSLRGSLRGSLRSSLRCARACPDGFTTSRGAFAVGCKNREDVSKSEDRAWHMQAGEVSSESRLARVVATATGGRPAPIPLVRRGGVMSKSTHDRVLARSAARVVSKRSSCALARRPRRSWPCVSIPITWCCCDGGASPPFPAAARSIPDADRSAAALLLSMSRRSGSKLVSDCSGCCGANGAWGGGCGVRS